MNIEARNFILSMNKELSGRKRAAFSFKATKTDVVSDRACIIWKNANITTLIYVINKLTDNQKIMDWFKNLYSTGKTLFIAFTGNTRKIYIERAEGTILKHDEYFNYSIEWKVGDEDNFKSRNYTWVSMDGDKYKDSISPCLYPYLNFSQCLMRTDGQVYIRHDKRVSQELTPKMYRGLFATMMDLQKDLDSVSLHNNILAMKKWLNIHKRRQAKFNWIQVTPESVTVYVC